MDTTPGKEPVVFKSQNASKSFKVNIKILAGIFVFVFMVGGIGTGVYLTQRSQQLTSRASLDKVDLALQPSEISATASGQFQTDVVDRKSTRLNSSHMSISYAVFCLKTK